MYDDLFDFFPSRVLHAFLKDFMLATHKPVDIAAVVSGLVCLSGDYGHECDYTVSRPDFYRAVIKAYPGYGIAHFTDKLQDYLAENEDA